RAFFVFVAVSTTSLSVNAQKPQTSGEAAIAEMANSAAGQPTSSKMPDPKKCVVVVDDAGNVGLKISDAQSAHEAVVTALRKRLGTDAVVYEGAEKNAAAMKKMLGAASETTIQNEQLAYFAAATKAAPWRVRVRFGSKKGEHWITVGCRLAKDKPTTPTDEKRFVGKSFAEAKEKLDAAMPTFCPLLPTAAAQAPTTPTAPGEIPGLRKKKPLAPWSPPPQR
ncbi:MAG TPA: hypothetical protein VGF99_09655, partial [Myxococcota bacterium]